jgi:hypothetical protein
VNAINDRAEEVQRLTALYGEQYRGLIKWALEFLNGREPQYRLPEPEARDQYIWRLIERALEIR